MFSSIRPSSPTDPRPKRFDQIVVDAALKSMNSLKPWVQSKGLDMTDEALYFALSICLSRSEGEAFLAANVVQTAFGVPADARLVAILDAASDLTRLHWEQAMRAWVIRTGYRIPAAQDDEIEFIAEDGKVTAGKISAVSPGMGVAYATDGDGHHHRLYGEQIIANTTQARYGLEEPVLGARYEDAPALVAASPAPSAIAHGAGSSGAKLPTPANAKPAGIRLAVVDGRTVIEPIADAQVGALARQQAIADAYRLGVFGKDDDTGPEVA